MSYSKEDFDCDIDWLLGDYKTEAELRNWLSNVIKASEGVIE